MNSKVKITLLLLLLATVFAVSGAWAETLAPGDKGAEVLALQNRLTELEYYTAKPTSKYDTATKKSVALFQTCNNLPSTGKADAKTMLVISDKATIPYGEYVQRQADAQCKPGMKGSYVKTVQKRLKTYSYFTGSANGNYGLKTETAVVMFQKANNLAQTGIADRMTRTLLTGKTAVKYKTFIANNNLTTLSSSSELKEQILFYQNQLISLGYLKATTGKYDKTTIKATKYFQAANGLTVSGKANIETRMFINECTGNGITPVPGSTIAGTDRKVVTYAEYERLQRYVESRNGKSGLNVELMQQKLYELGYLAKSKVTGKFGAGTKISVTKFQNFNNIPMTGIADTQTLTLLHSGNAFSFAQVQGPDSLKKGMQSTAVKNMQLRLKKLGFFSGECNGKFGDLTMKAVKAYQKSIGYTVTGIAYSTTLAKLRAAVPDDDVMTNMSNEKVEKILEIAESKLSCKYGHDDGPNVFDCCGFVRYCYYQGAKITLPWTVKGQATYAKGEKITSLSDCKRGDILIFENDETGSKYSKYSHSTLYLGNGAIIHASSSQGKVVVTNIKSGYSANYYQEHFIVGVRIFP